MTHFYMQSADNKGERLFILREKLGLKQREFTEKLGIAQNNLSNMEKGTRAIGKNISKNIITTFGVNPIWWETGLGDMFLHEQSQTQKMGDMMQVQNGQTQKSSGGPWEVIPYLKENLVKVPLLEFNARAGLVDNLDNITEYLTEFTLVLPHKGEKYEKALAIRIDGDSMEPELRRGDTVLAFYQEKSEWEYLNPGVYAIIFRNSFVVKRIKKNTLRQTGEVELFSDNEIHGPILVNGEDLRAIWKVGRLVDRQIF